MNNIINVISNNVGNESVNTVNARDLHSALQVGRMYATWVKERLEKCRFVEGVDYVVCFPKAESALSLLRSPDLESDLRGGQNKVDYFLTIEAAKALAMLQNNEQGDIVRKYFIDMEKQAKQQVFPQTRLEWIQMALEQEKKLVAQQEKIEHQAIIIEAQNPAVLFVENFVAKGLNMTLTDAWKGLGLKPNKFSAVLGESGLLFKRVGGKNWLAKQAHIDAGHFIMRVTDYGTQTLVTPKGMLYISKKFDSYITKGETNGN